MAIKKTAIENVRVFDGIGIRPPSTVVIIGDVIGKLEDIDAATERVDGKGGVLLPGLIDSHVHPLSVTHIESLTKYGVTTALAMASFSPTMSDKLQGHDGLCDIRRVSASASAPNSSHGRLVVSMADNDDDLLGDVGDPKEWMESLLVHGSSDAAAWVQRQVREWDPEYIKIIAETPGHDQQTLDILVQESHRLGKKVVCHAATLEAQEQARACGADQIHHMPTDTAIDAAFARSIREAPNGVFVVPTLSILKVFAVIRPGRSYKPCQDSVKAYFDAGVPVLVGTDANLHVAKVLFGKSMHHELELLVEAGLPIIDALRGATCLAAEKWGLHDRGVIEPGRRADLVLIQGNPIEDIKATRNIERVWVTGKEYEKELGTFET